MMFKSPRSGPAPRMAPRDDPRHGAAMLRRPRTGRPAAPETAPALRPQFNDWAMI